MKKVSLKQKRWFIAKSKHEIRRRQKKNLAHDKSLARQKADNNKAPTPIKVAQGTAIVTAPKIMCIFENSSETLDFFKQVSDIIRRLKYREKLFFDLSNVEVVSVDAIMYLIATIKNTKRIKALQIDCAGNVPSNAEAQRVFETCGFYKYVSPQYNIKYSSENDHINITRGHEADPVLAGKICEFVHGHSHCDRLATKSLYTMIMELMTNTKQHAYTNNRYMDNNWYVFVEDTSNYMSFVFLDTGAGIPNTIRTNGIFEKIKSFLNADDAFFIASALRGELRSETKLEYRGKGLPEIYKRVSNGYINEFSIVSGYGKCEIAQNGEIIETKLSSELIGTMLCWKLVKQNKEVIE